MKNILEIIILAFILVLAGIFIVLFVSEKMESPQVLTDFSRNGGKEVLKKLNLDQKIGQLFIIGFNGKVLTPEIEKIILEIQPGGILLLDRNIDPVRNHARPAESGAPEGPKGRAISNGVEDENQLKNLISSFQKLSLNYSGLPLFIAVDQEGGEISRIDWLDKTSQSEIKDKENAYEIGKKRGRELKELGINLNLAPLLDITSAKDFIFKRSFQKESEIIKELSESLIKGQKEAGILTAVKHFPGYGGIAFNPEEKLAVLEKIPEISQFNDNRAEIIMFSNAVYKEIDEKLPFIFSEKGINFLRAQIKGDYLLISDDLDQNSLLKEFSLDEIVALPFKAGVDILIFSGWRKPAEDGVEAFKKAVEKGEISEERINRSVLKIIELKKRMM